MIDQLPIALRPASRARTKKGPRRGGPESELQGLDVSYCFWFLASVARVLPAPTPGRPHAAVAVVVVTVGIGSTDEGKAVLDEVVPEAEPMPEGNPAGVDTCGMDRREMSNTGRLNGDR